MPSEYAASLTRRFQDASRTFEDRERRRVLAEAAAGRLETLATELEQLLASDQPVEEVVARWRGLRRDADVLREHAPANMAAAERLERAVAALEEKELQYQQARAKVEQDHLRRFQQLCRQVETLAATEQITLKAGDRALREIRSAIDERVPLPSKQRSAGDPGASRGGARRAGAARAGAARRRRVAALGQPAGAGGNLSRDGGAQEPRRTSRSPAAACASCRRAGSRWRWRPGRRARSCGGASRPRRMKCSRARPRTSPRRTRSAPATSPASRRCASAPRHWPIPRTG